MKPPLEHGCALLPALAGQHARQADVQRRRVAHTLLPDESSGKELEANWLPAPKGNFTLMMRMYWPKETAPSILPPGKGSWTIPPVKMAAK